MGVTTRLLNDSDLSTHGKTDDALKGLLMDKGAGVIERKIRIIQRKMTLVQCAMEELVEKQRSSARAFGCDCIDLYLAGLKNPKNQELKNTKVRVAELEYEDLIAPCVLEWRGRHAFILKHGLNPRSRLHPFVSGHPTQIILENYIKATSPSYYKVLAAYETARLTLNSSLKALRKLATEMHEIKDKSKNIPEGIFDRETNRMSREVLGSLKQGEELSWVLQGLYFDY